VDKAVHSACLSRLTYRSDGKRPGVSPRGLLLLPAGETDLQTCDLLPLVQTEKRKLCLVQTHSVFSAC